jgi:hypothetical protein
VKLLVGRNPFELIREDRSNPGHFREYTLGEIVSFAEQTGFAVIRRFRRFYFDARYAHHEDGTTRKQLALGTIKNVVYRCLPSFLREGITVVLSRSV